MLIVGCQDGRRGGDVEVEAMVMAPVPTPEVLWRRAPVLALAAVPGTELGHLGAPSTASAAAWAAAGAAIRRVHDAPLPPWPGRRSWRCLVVTRWLVGAGSGSPEDFPEVALLRSRVSRSAIRG